jgi:hypothetical protein
MEAQKLTDPTDPDRHPDPKRFPTDDVLASKVGLKNLSY